MTEKRVCEVCGTIYEDAFDRCPLCETPYQAPAADNDDYDEYYYDEEKPAKSRAKQSGGGRGFKIFSAIVLILLLIGFGLFIAYEWVIGSPSIHGNVPCTGLYLAEDEISLTQADESYFLSVNATPDDVTDPVGYVSADETIAVVDEHGKITAVAEGETQITVTCGDYSAECVVVCEFVEE